MKKIKKMSIEKLQNDFPSIGKTEQDLYVGKAKYVFDPNTKKWEVDYNSSTLLDCVSIKYTTGIIFMSVGEGERLKDAFNNTSSNYTTYNGNTKNFFELLDDNTEYEWSLSIKSNGTAKIHTDYLTNNVQQFIAPDTQQLIHSHNLKYVLGEPSTEDKDIAKDYPQISFSLRIKNQLYRNYDKYGFFGSWYY